MKKGIVTKTLLVAAGLLFMSASPISDGTCKGIALHGRVKIVSSHADFEVRVVDHHADLHVKVVESHPNSCGEWQFVESHPDFTVRFVDHHEDFSIRYVSSHPGVQ